VVFCIVLKRVIRFIRSSYLRSNNEQGGLWMAFNKIGTPAPVSNVTASCGCDRCSSNAMCTLQDGRYLCPECLSEKTVNETPLPCGDGKEGGQNGVS